MTTNTAARPEFFRDAALLAGRAVRETFRSPATIVLGSFFPLVMLLAMTLGFADVVLPGRGYAGYVNYSLPLFIVMGVVFAALNTAVATYRDLHGGMDARLRTVAIARSAPLLGRVGADAVRNLATTVLVFLLGFALGFRFAAGPLAILGFFLLPVVFGFGIAWFMVAIAMRAKSAETAISLVNVLLLVLSFLSTGFAPKGSLAGWAEPIAAVNPLSSAIDAMRGLAHGGELTGPLLATLAWTVALTAVFGAVAVSAYRSRGERRSG
ncbi:ABC transporter permease [Sciscionella marina]|uniref:ABC transporter permease n=1 Tax=Sciscionella marina TaxID=508770 RepID=UPI00037F197B|nr:ABC transporter permease [Sciscionella marina]